MKYVCKKCGEPLEEIKDFGFTCLTRKDGELCRGIIRKGDVNLAYQQRLEEIRILRTCIQKIYERIEQEQNHLKERKKQMDYICLVLEV